MSFHETTCTYKWYFLFYVLMMYIWSVPEFPLDDSHVRVYYWTLRSQCFELFL